MRLGIDLDGVVADFNAGWTALHRSEFGSDVESGMVTTWNGLHTIAGFDSMDAFWEWASPTEHRRSIFRHLDPLPDAVESLHALRADGHEIVIITTKPEMSRTDTFHWIADNDIPTSEVHLTNHKHRVQCDVYLDDSPHVLRDLVRHRPDALIGRMVRPWNEALDGTVSIESWANFLATVREHR